MQEKIYEVALSDDRKPDASGKVEPAGNAVDVKMVIYKDFRRWSQDPDFDASASAFCYVRTLQIPRLRGSTYDAEGVASRDDLPASIQEHSWTSPIWYMRRGELEALQNGVQWRSST